SRSGPVQSLPRTRAVVEILREILQNVVEGGSWHSWHTLSLGCVVPESRRHRARLVGASPSMSRSKGSRMAVAEYPKRYRRVPHGPREFAAFHAECAALLDEASALDGAQRALSFKLAAVRTKLAELRVVMWPRVEPNDIVHGFRVTHRGGPPPIPPVAPN